ncbi:hypothetical protein [Nocardia aurantia]|uniref:Transposase (putative) YhgA-like domain-containing protein n=1 Tax=Nocardia aurantia TaxID=2585199 RepID=A0A7K0DXX9_9NOCA|nr:hypothetical protein [Nocardia aurantia]MQY30650.1 hypothetical protein [Nocardia aurantia]
MPTLLHESFADLLRETPTLTVDLHRMHRRDSLPSYDDVRRESGDFPDIDPTEYRSDGVVVLTFGSEPRLAIVIEIQLRHDPDKAWTWPVYLTTLRSRLRCPTLLLVMCPTERAAQHCREAIEITSGCTFVPWVIGPSDLPVVTDPVVVAENIRLAAIFAIVHRRNPQIEAILRALVDAIGDDEKYLRYIDLVGANMPKPTRRYLENLMSSSEHKYKMAYTRHFYNDGKIDGEAESLLRVLHRRGFEVTKDVVAKIRACTDRQTIEAWIDRAVDARTLDAVFLD